MRAKIKVPRINNFGDKLRRAGWIFLAALFIFTGLGVGVYAFWQGTHQTNNPLTQQNPNNSNSCAFSGAESGPVLPKPQTYIPETNTSALITSDIQSGSGPAAKAGDCVKVKYYGTIASTGKTSAGLEDFSQPLALQFQLGQGYVIPGWDQGLVGLKVGGERRLVIPSKLAYGSMGQCAVQGQNPCKDYAIPPNTNLVFYVKLLSIK